MTDFYTAILKQITQANCLYEARELARGALTPIPDYLRRPDERHNEAGQGQGTDRH